MLAEAWWPTLASRCRRRLGGQILLSRCSIGESALPAPNRQFVRRSLEPGDHRLTAGPSKRREFTWVIAK